MNKLVITSDNSPTLLSERFDQCYHSSKGAVSESQHVFFDNGINEVVNEKSKLSVFEVGFGTGINTAMTLQYARDKRINIHYDSIELYPITEHEAKEVIGNSGDLAKDLGRVHSQEWNKEQNVNDYFILCKIHADLLKYTTEKKYDVIFFDAFSPNVQSELWSEDVMSKMYDMLNINGLLTTYCAQGEMKRTMKKVGFQIVCPPGPLGKREMTQGFKRTK